MKYAIEMGSDSMIYIPSFIKDRLSHSNVHQGDAHTYRHTDSMERSHDTSLLSFFQNKESRLITR
jgi:hypothetical protein